MGRRRRTFNEFKRAADFRREWYARRDRARKGIDECAWQAEHRIWSVWVFNYENLKLEIENEHYAIAHQYDKPGQNIAAN